MQRILSKRSLAHAPLRGMLCPCRVVRGATEDLVKWEELAYAESTWETDEGAIRVLFVVRVVLISCRAGGQQECHRAL